MNKHSRDLVKLDFLKYSCLCRVMNWILSVIKFYLNAGKRAHYTHWSLYLTFAMLS